MIDFRASQPVAESPRFELPSDERRARVDRATSGSDAVLGLPPRSAAARPARGLALAAALLAGTTGCADSETPAGPYATILLVTIDTTRADAIGAYGSPDARTPHLDALAARGRLFERAYAPTPITLPSHTSLLTGTYPCAHGVRDNAIFRVAEESQLVSELLAERGWRTGAFVGSFVLDGSFGLDQGFERYTGPRTDELGAKPSIVERPASEVVDDAVAWLAEVGADESLFLWAHFYDPHHPYEPPAPFDAESMRPYDGEIAFADAQLGRLLAEVRAAGRGERMLTIVTSDHGESLGEHGESTHGVFLYDATMRVPLVVAGAGVTPGRVDGAVSLTDVVPTLLDWLDLPVDTLAAARGRSLLREGTGADDRAVYLESLLPFYSHRWHPLRGLVWQGHKLVDGVRTELYDLARDPGEQTNAADDDKDRAAAMSSRLEALVSEHGALGWVEEGAVDDETRAALAALGYVSGATAGDPFDHSLPDPVERIGDLAMLDRALDLLRQGRYLLGVDADSPATLDGVDPAEREAWGQRSLEEARSLLLELRARNPSDPKLTGNLGLVELSRSDHRAAIPYFEEAAAADPEPAVTHFNLGLCYAAVGDEHLAEHEMRIVLTCEPRFTGAYEWLAHHHERNGAPGRAAWWRGEQEREARLSVTDLPRVKAERRRLTDLARRSGQDVEPPADFPVDDLRPAAVQGREGPRR